MPLYNDSPHDHNIGIYLGPVRGSGSKRLNLLYSLQENLLRLLALISLSDNCAKLYAASLPASSYRSGDALQGQTTYEDVFGASPIKELVAMQRTGKNGIAEVGMGSRQHQTSSDVQILAQWMINKWFTRSK